LGFGLWVEGPETETWDLSWTRPSQVKSMARRVGSIIVLGSVQLFFLHVFFIFCTSLGEACRRGCEAKTWQLQNQPTNENF